MCGKISLKSLVLNNESTLMFKDTMYKHTKFERNIYMEGSGRATMK